MDGRACRLPLGRRARPRVVRGAIQCRRHRPPLRNYDSALASYETALALRPDSVDARYNFALALKAAGYVPDAADELKKSSRRNPAKCGHT